MNPASEVLGAPEDVVAGDFRLQGECNGILEEGETIEAEADPGVHPLLLRPGIRL